MFFLLLKFSYISLLLGIASFSFHYSLAYYESSFSLFLKKDFFQFLNQLKQADLFIFYGWILVGLFVFIQLLRVVFFYFKKRKKNDFFSTIKSLDDMYSKLSHYTFEDFIVYFYTKQGYKAYRTGVGSNCKKDKKDPTFGDGGKDVVLKRKYRKDIIVQCKFYSPDNLINVSTVREMIGVMVHYKARKIILITTSDFTQPAKDFAKGKKIELINGEELVKRINKLKHF